MEGHKSKGELVVLEEAALKSVRFDEPGPSIPGAITRRGYYENPRSQRFEVSAAAQLDDERAFEEFLVELRVSYEADLVNGAAEPGRLDEGPVASDEDLEALLRCVVAVAEEERDEGAPRGAAIALVSVLKEAEGIESPSMISVAAAIDPQIRRGACHGYQGPDDVAADVSNGQVRLGGLTFRAPVVVGVNSPYRLYDANRFCTVSGVALGSRYALGSKWNLIWRTT